MSSLDDILALATDLKKANLPDTQMRDALDTMRLVLGIDPEYARQPYPSGYQDPRDGASDGNWTPEDHRTEARWHLDVALLQERAHRTEEASSDHGQGALPLDLPDPEDDL